MSHAPVVTKPPPARGWYVVAAVIVLAAFGGGALFIVSQIKGMGDRLIQVVVPGQANLDLRETGSYTIFHEYQSVVDGKVYSAPSLSGLQVAVWSPGGTLVDLVRPTATSRYTFSGRAGISLFAFEVPAPGVYRIAASYDTGRSEPRTVLAVGSGFVGRIIETALIAIAIIFSGVGIAVAIIVVVVLARRRALAPQPQGR